MNRVRIAAVFVRTEDLGGDQAASLSSIMKFCPTCETHYDEEILRFCTKDGTPLIEEGQPSFTDLPSESEDFGEETIVNYKPKNIVVPPVSELPQADAPRIVISTDEQKRDQNVRARTIPPYQPIAEKSNTAKVVILTILGTLAVLAMGVGLFVFLREEKTSDSNLNVNTNPPNVNLNTNLNFGSTNYNVSSNTNFNMSTNFNTSFNSNFNANVKSPTPTPKPSPNANMPLNANVGGLNTNVMSTPKPSPSANISPKPSVSPKPATPTPSATPKAPSTPPLPGGRPVNGN